MQNNKFSWQNEYPHPRTPIFASNIVATSQPLAAQAGLSVLQRGGNAIDAAIAAAAAITVVEPVSNGLGSDAFAIVWDGKKLHGLNASGRSPAAWTREYFERQHNGTMPERGVDTVTVPGAVSAWGEMHARFAQLPLGDLLAPAIDLADKGFAVSPVVQRKWASQAPVLENQPGFRDVFMPYGRAPNVGERMNMPGAAHTLREIADHGIDTFYQGEIAEQLCKFVQANGGALSLSDMQAHRADWCGTISQHYRGYDLHEIPPNGQGIAALMALGILQHFELDALHPDSVEVRHLQIEAMKAAFADVYQYVADPESMQSVTPDHLLDASYLKQRAALIKREKATHFHAGVPPAGGTIYLTTADASGMMVSYIQSNYMGFGSGVVAQDLGISLQNRGSGFCLDAGHPNLVSPGKRPFHTIIPGFLMKSGQPQMSFGVMGGNMQPQGHMQTVSRMVDHNQNPQAACDAPRWRVHKGLTIDLESQMEASVTDALRTLGHDITPVTDTYMDFGAGQFIWRLGDSIEEGYVAASDSRRDGHAACC